MCWAMQFKAARPPRLPSRAAPKKKAASCAAASSASEPWHAFLVLSAAPQDSRLNMSHCQCGCDHGIKRGAWRRL